MIKKSCSTLNNYFILSKKLTLSNTQKHIDVTPSGVETTIMDILIYCRTDY